ncbi:hypothetical protein Syun_008483 [Stephania yunnanensis]|uniref:Uncharacterized protein n=1 Tax=Stephania yunnanensis TaxID=152371 RepID=A0AAP0PPN3_9MAGN
MMIYEVFTSPIISERRTYHSRCQLYVNIVEVFNPFVSRIKCPCPLPHQYMPLAF